ncbi:MAG: hypothetical protein V3T95_01160 [Acidobacteriota bacterium]
MSDEQPAPDYDQNHRPKFVDADINDSELLEKKEGTDPHQEEATDE